MTQKAGLGAGQNQAWVPAWGVPPYDTPLTGKGPPCRGRCVAQHALPEGRKPENLTETGPA